MMDIEAILHGNRLALARLLTQIENDTPAGREALSALFPRTGRAHLIGVTGAPGTGKSSLVNQLARHYRKAPLPQRVAIIAVDPSSPFTGGAVLGDRIRMTDLSGDPGVFIRSMASRGSLGGLARATAGIVQAFDAAGYEIILIETVGAGQAEVDIARLAHTTLVVEAPGLGDEIQAIKAGILEIADVLVINKADRPGVENTERALRGMLQLAHPVQRIFRHHGRIEHLAPATSTPDTPLWLPPIQRTVASEGKGIAELAQSISRHREHLIQTGDLERREMARLQNELELRVQETLVNRWRSTMTNGQYRLTLEKLLKREVSPDEAAHELTQESVR
ncbi:MAG: methylmalonyl Co-A mutase-associated GTPase MeaB [Anaerolineales bacterium]